MQSKNVTTCGKKKEEILINPPDFFFSRWQPAVVEEDECERCVSPCKPLPDWTTLLLN